MLTDNCWRNSLENVCMPRNEPVRHLMHPTANKKRYCDLITSKSFTLQKKFRIRSLFVPGNLPTYHMNTYFSVRAKCCHRGGVGARFPETYNDPQFLVTLAISAESMPSPPCFRVPSLPFWIPKSFLLLYLFFLPVLRFLVASFCQDFFSIFFILKLGWKFGKKILPQSLQSWT